MIPSFLERLEPCAIRIGAGALNDGTALPALGGLIPWKSHLAGDWNMAGL